MRPASSSARRARSAATACQGSSRPAPSSACRCSRRGGERCESVRRALGRAGHNAKHCQFPRPPPMRRVGRGSDEQRNMRGALPPTLAHVRVAWARARSTHTFVRGEVMYVSRFDYFRPTLFPTRWWGEPPPKSRCTPSAARAKPPAGRERDAETRPPTVDPQFWCVRGVAPSRMSMMGIGAEAR